MKVYILSFTVFALLSTHLAHASLTPACKRFETEWRKLGIQKENEQVQKVLEFVKTYPGDPPEPDLHPDWQGTAKEKLEIIYATPSCFTISRFDAYKFLLRSNLNPVDQRTVLNLLLNEIVTSAKNRSGAYSLVLNRALIQMSLEQQKLRTTEAQGFELKHISNEVSHLQNEMRLSNYHTCDTPSRCSDDFAAKTLEKVEYFRAEETRIHQEFSFWAMVLMENEK